MTISVTQLAVDCLKKIEDQHLGFDGKTGLNSLFKDIEAEICTIALDQAGGCVAKAARRLGLNRTTLVEKLKRLNVAPHAGDQNARSKALS